MTRLTITIEQVKYAGLSRKSLASILGFSYSGMCNLIGANPRKRWERDRHEEAMATLRAYRAERERKLLGIRVREVS